jgi:hypothetical protein
MIKIDKKLPVRNVLNNFQMGDMNVTKKKFPRKLLLNFSLPTKVIAHPHVVTICVLFGCSQQQGAEALIPNVNQEEESWDDDSNKVQYHKLPLPQSSIFVVDTEDSFEKFLDYIKVCVVRPSI